MSVFSIFDPAVGLAHRAVGGLTHLVPAAAAIVLFTICVRLLLHPLARAAARGEQSRARLAPRLGELQRRHRGDPERLQQALAELYREEQASPFAGCLPMLVQLPFFSVMYRLFTLPRVAGRPNDLLGHTLFGVSLGTRLTGAHGPGQFAVFGALYAALAGIGYLTFRRTRAAAAAAPQQQPGAAVLPYLSFGTVLFAVLVPLAAALYLLTTGAWSAAERAWLYRGNQARPADGAPPTAEPATRTTPSRKPASRKSRRQPRSQAAR
jgi:YidC/Oxa1 family membrane protein insertase